jgi:hypothetical protein
MRVYTHTQGHAHINMHMSDICIYIHTHVLTYVLTYAYTLVQA